MSHASGVSSDPNPREGSIPRVFRRDLTRLGLSLLLLAVVLFLSAGDLEWRAGWAYLALVAANTTVMVYAVDPDLMRERTRRHRDAKKWDLALIALLAWLLPTLTLVVAGLDRRYGWSPPRGFGVPLLSGLLAAAGLGLADWAMLTNRFFSVVVRIQRDRHHVVVTGGPYRYVRHPGYLGALVFSLATPPLLGSAWAWFPAAATGLVLAIRTALEDRMLRNELEGYAEYAGRVPYRLFPGLW